MKSKFSAAIQIVILSLLFLHSLSAQQQIEIEGDANSTDTVAIIKVNSTAPFTDVLGLYVKSEPTVGRGIGASYYGGWNGIVCQSRSGSALWTESTSSYGLFSRGVRGGYFRGEGGIDILLGGSVYQGSGADEGVIATDNSKSSSDMWLVANDAVVIELDDDDDEEGTFEIMNGGDTTVFSVNEVGKVNSGHLEIAGRAYGNGGGSDEAVIESDQDKSSSDLWLVSNDAVVVALDDDNNESGHFEIKNGGDTTVLSVSESGTVDVNGEIQRKETGSANMVPICFGLIDSDGTILTGSGNFTVSINALDDYVITITDHNFIWTNYIVQVTPRSLGIPSTLFSSDGNLAVTLFDTFLMKKTGAFNFLVFKP